MDENDVEIIIPEDERLVVCPKCNTTNPEGSNFCLFCGVSLQRRSSRKTNWTWLLVFILLSLGLGFYYYARLARLDLQKSIPDVSQIKFSTPPKETIKTASEDLTTEELADEITVWPEIRIPVGMVVIKDITGKVLHEVPAAVTDGGWVALPRRVCLGGAHWILKLWPDQEFIIAGGIVSDDDDVGLWRIAENQTIEGPELHPWSVEEPLAWLFLAAQDSPEPVQIESPNVRGYFIEGSLPEDFDEMGILVQQDRVVGWTFGDLASGAFIWNGDEGKFLRPEIRVDDFYRITFANGREEEFTLALAMTEENSVLERLQGLANGFRFDPKLSAKNTPAHLKTEAITAKMRALINKALQAGYAREVAYIFDAQILTEAADIVLLIEVAGATAEEYGFEAAIELTENVADGLPELDHGDLQKLEKSLSALYQDWIVALIKKENLQSAWRAYRSGSRRLPNDIDVHLLGVELALADNDWAEAERLLSIMAYPSNFSAKIQNLQTRISELKAQTGKIVIRFAPGIRYIPVTAVLNHTVSQPFIVDTGASMVTIPRASAESLGLAVDDRSPLRKVHTAGGVKLAPEVTLATITVEGWEVNNVKALVLDIPDQSGLGLLGLNYLSRFRMNINAEQGVLLLEPR
jgi:clan AA aspartic protease (TIGR02281 family)